MNDPLLVRRFEGLRDLPGDGQGVVEWDRTLRDAIRERGPFDELHHERLHAVGFFEAVDGRDVRMVQRREHFRFALESGEPLSVAGHRRRQDLQGDLAFQLRVGGAVDLAHSAYADLGGDLIGTEARAGSEGQW